MRSFRIARWCTLTALLSVASPSLADGIRVHGLIDFGSDFGGTKLVVSYASGAKNTLTSGEGFRIAGGVLFAPFRVDGHSAELQLTGGWKGWSMSTDADGSVSLTQGLVDALVFYRYEPGYFRLGGGLTFRVVPALTASGSAVEYLGFSSLPLGSALGYVVQVELAITGKLGFSAGVRYTFLRYSGAGTVPPIEASAVGVVVSLSAGMDFSPSEPPRE